MPVDLELEDGGGVRIAEDLVGGLVVERNLADIDDIAGGIFDVVLRHFDNGQVAQTQKSRISPTHVFHAAPCRTWIRVRRIRPPDTQGCNRKSCPAQSTRRLRAYPNRASGLPAFFASVISSSASSASINS